MENVEVITSEGKGRGLKATKEFWAADVIFAERAYSAVVFDRSRMWVVALFSPVGLAVATFSNILLSKSSEQGIKSMGPLIRNGIPTANCFLV